MFPRRNWALALCVCCALSFSFSFSRSLLWRLQSQESHPKAASAASNGVGLEPAHPCRTMNPIPEAMVVDAELCWELKRNLNTEVDPKRVDKDWIIRQFKLVQTCPWMHNASALGQYRKQLGRCCNASARLVLTQENTLLDSWIISDGQQTKKLQVQKDLLEILPQGSPFQGPPYECCAIVGNGAILRNSRCGPEIDRAQFVIRFNLPPLGFADDVGTKSDIITLNPSILQSRFHGLSRHHRPFAEAVGAYGAPQLLIPAFSFAGHSELAFRALYTLEDFNSPSRALFLNPKYLAGLDGHWRHQGLHAKRLSSGFMLVSAALELCQHITLYGFWPFPQAPDGQLLPHHYYDDEPPKQGIHAMPDEFTHYRAMHLQGALRLHLGCCR